MEVIYIIIFNKKSFKFFQGYHQSSFNLFKCKKKDCSTFNFRNYIHVNVHSHSYTYTKNVDFYVYDYRIEYPRWY